MKIHRKRFKKFVEFSSDISDTSDVQLKLVQKFAVVSGSKIVDNDLIIQHVDILDRIGSGNFGSVFRGKMGMTLVAVKQLNSFESSTLLEEAKMLYLLRSPFIVQFLGIFRQKEEWYLVTEYLPKGSLEHFLLKKDRQLDTLLSMLVTGAQGLDYLASKRIIHRGVENR
jgi:serine/threonine protein kinase